ncbi:MAG: ATP-binding protein [Pseudomonadota bacterium]
MMTIFGRNVFSKQVLNLVPRQIGFALVLALGAFLILAGTRAGASQGVVSVGVYENPPKIFTQESGTPSGIFIDIIEAIASQEGWTLRYVPGTWSQGLSRLARAEIDLMPDVALTPAREKEFTFHQEPVLSDWFQVYARRGSKIRSLVDLAGQRIVVLERSAQKDAFEQLVQGFGFETSIITLPDYTAIFSTVARAEADAAITNRFYGAMKAPGSGLEDTAIIFNPTRLFFAAPPGRADPALLAAIDRHLVRLKENHRSVYYTSLARWTSQEVAFVLPTWVRFLGLGVGVALAMSLVGSVVLKRQVNDRTRELTVINREMEQRIRDRTAELAVAMEKAQAADHLKSAFLATMSHELRTPLNSIIGFTGILLQGLAGPLNDEQKKQLTMVQSSSRHLLALINDVLDISKIEADQLTLDCNRFDIRPSITKTATLIKPLAGKKGLDLRLDIAPDVGEVFTDQRRLEQILLNLSGNAVKFTEKGHVRIGCRRQGDGYLLEVSDTGTGIRPEDLDGLFQPFHQIDTGLSRRHEGTGLGLSICKKLITLMGGTIQVDSQWGRGSTFSIRLPSHPGGIS